MPLAASAVRMYLFYAFGVILLVATAAVLGTVLPRSVALLVAFLVLLVGVFGGLFWHGQLRQ